MVKFGKRFLEEQEVLWLAHYLDYKLLKKQINHLSSKVKGNTAAIHQLRFHFIKVLNEEVDKVEKFGSTTYQQIEATVALSWRQVSKFYASIENEQVESAAIVAQTEKVREIIHRIEEEMCKTQKYVQLNATAVRKISKKWDKEMQDGYMLSWYGLFIKNSESFPTMLKEKINSLLATISKIHVLLRNIDKKRDEVHSGKGKSDTDKKASKWTPPESFERETTKYWVQYSDLLHVKLAILKHLPLLIFGEEDNPGVKPPKRGEDEHVWHAPEELLAKRTSITETGDKHDSALITSVYFDSDDFISYDSRLRRREGAELIRVRWYGDTPKPEDKVFVERKTHHESWVHDPSIKERVTLQYNKLNSYINGELNCASEALEWGGMEESKKQKQCKLLQETQESILKRKLKPKIRSAYMRCAFQLASTNAIRISIDSDLWLVNEEPRSNTIELALGDDMKSARTKWCLSTEEVSLLQHAAAPSRLLDRDDIGKVDAYRFPYAILEVKLQSESPQWLESLINDHHLVRVHKFSKFITGSVLSHRDALKVMPHWFEKDGTIDFNARGEFFSSEPGVGHRNPAAISSSQEASEADIENPMSSETDRVTVTVKGSIELPSETKCVKKDSVVPSKNLVPPKYVPVKVEPKSFFANERTFIQWLSAALLMLTLGGALINLSTDISSPGSVLGFTVLGSGMIFAIYALVIFNLRAQKLRDRADGPYDERFGPAALVILLLIAMISNVVAIAQSKLSNSKLSIRDNEISCQLLTTGAGSDPFFVSYKNNPSGLALLPEDEPRALGFLFTSGSGSLNEMKVKYSEDPTKGIEVNGAPTQIFQLPDAYSHLKLRGMVVVGDTANVLVENPTLSILQIDLASKSILNLTDLNLGYKGNTPRESMEYEGGISILDEASTKIGLSTFDGIVVANISDVARELVAVDLLNGEIEKRYSLPGTKNEKWSGIYVDETRKSIFLTCSYPPGIWRFQFDKSTGFPTSC